jgi:hypothetical protein
MSVLILLSVPSLSAILCMVAAITDLTLYLRLPGRPCRVIPFPAYPDRLSGHRVSR